MLAQMNIDFSYCLSSSMTSRRNPVFCPTLTKGSNWQITQIWESDIFRLDLAYFSSIPSLEQKHSSYRKIFKSRHNDIASMSMYMTDTFGSFTRNVIFKSCFLLSEYVSIAMTIYPLLRTWLLLQNVTRKVIGMLLSLTVVLTLYIPEQC